MATASEAMAANPKLSTSSELITPLANPNKETESDRQAIRRRLKATLEAMNARPWTADAVDVALSILATCPLETVFHALSGCALEICGDGYQPTLSLGDITKRLGVVTHSQREDAECRAAWDALLLYADKHIVSDPEGNYGPRRYFGMKTDIPELDQRTADCLRRIGRWSAIKTMTQDNYPFVQKRFYEEYRAWDATAAALNSGALNGNEPFKTLVEKTAMPERKRIAAPSLAASAATTGYTPRPRVQARNSRETLLEQTKLLEAQRTGNGNGCSKTPAPAEAVTR